MAFCKHVLLQVYAALVQVPNMRVYGKQDVPERFHYKGGRFVSPLTLVAEPGWFIAKVTNPESVNATFS